MSGGIARIVLVVCGWLGVGTVLCQNRLQISISNIKSNDGMVIVALFDKSDLFLKKPCIHEKVKASSPTTSVVIDNLELKSYAISVIHDENNNGELDTNWIGIPKEAFGFGNDAMGSFGPPTFQQAAIELNGPNVNINVRLKHY